MNAKRSAQYALARQAALLGAPLPVWIAFIFSYGLETQARSPATLDEDFSFDPGGFAKIGLYLREKGGGRPLVTVVVAGLVRMSDIRDALIASKVYVRLVPRAASDRRASTLGWPVRSAP